MARVLKTRLVGQAPHWSGHPLAKPEYVYQVERAPRRKGRLPNDIAAIALIGVVALLTNVAFDQALPSAGAVVLVASICGAAIVMRIGSEILKG